jgi:uncharacterized membrane protein (DUF2068 family)
MNTEPSRAREPRFGLLRLIALYKIVKVLLLLLVAYGELRLRDASLVAKLLAWASSQPYGVEHHYGLEHRIVSQLVEWFSGLSSSRADVVRLVTLAYAAVFAIEGIGLWMQKRWAEWLTVVITASLVPLEIWEMIHRPTWGKLAILLGNTGIVIYLIWHVRTHAKPASPPLVAQVNK